MLLLQTLLVLVGLDACALTAGAEVHGLAQTDDQTPPETIVGGTDIAPGSRPYLLRSPQGCGGSLISPRAVLTAAHCMYDSSGNWNPLMAFEFFRHDIKDDSGVVIMNIRDTNEGGKDIVVHPLYNATTNNHDAAVVFLPVAIHDITPVILNDDPSVPQDGDPLDVAGWGTTVFGGAGSDVPLATTVNYLPTDNCTSPPRLYKKSEITANMMCAAAEGTDVCNGDSGGPLVLSTRSSKGVSVNHTLQVAIVSFSYKDFGCASVQYPGVQTRVSAVVSWIRRSVCARTGDLCEPKMKPKSSKLTRTK